METTLHSSDKTWKKGTYDFLYKKTIFLCDYLAKSYGVFTELKENSHSFIIRFEFSDFIKDSFAIDTQMPIVIFLGQSVYIRIHVK